MIATRRIVDLVVYIGALHLAVSFSQVHRNSASLRSNPSRWTRNTFSASRFDNNLFGILMSSDDNGVVELVDDEDAKLSVDEQGSVAPFLSQGGISDEALNPDLSNPKQTRVILYIIISLVPVLFLIPLMIGSRDLIPLDALPPVEY